MYSTRVRRAALDLIHGGAALSEVSRAMSIERSTLRAWRDGAADHVLSGACPDCDGAQLHRPGYSALLGYYLGDGCISQSTGGSYFLRVSCDAALPSIIADIERLLAHVRPGAKTFRVSAPGVIIVQSNWKHWPCLFPQHGPGRKHERRIALEPWQEEIVAAHPGDFLRGLFHSDGSRVANWATRVVNGTQKRYDYPRWMFVNSSDDIIDLCTTTLDAVGIAWRRPRVNCIAVSRQAEVAALDALIGPKA